MEGGGVRLQGHHVGPNNTRPATGSGSVQSLVRMKRCHDDLILLPVSISNGAGRGLPDVSGVSLSNTNKK